MKHILKRTFCVWWPVLLAAGFLCGCASTTQVLPRPTEEKPTANKALIVVERASTTFGNDGGGGGGVGNKVYDNNKLVGTLAKGGKLVWLRNPGLMDIKIDGHPLVPFLDNSGRGLAVAAGESYRYEIKCYASTGFTFNGPGIPTSNYSAEYQSSEGSLIFFRFFPIHKHNKGGGLIVLVDVKTGKHIQVDNDPHGKKDPWVVLYLPPGEYNVLRYDYFSVSGSGLLYHRVDAEFTVTKTNVGIYVGDIRFSDGKFSISQDSNAAREFLKQTEIKLPYTEAIMALKR